MGIPKSIICCLALFMPFSACSCPTTPGVSFNESCVSLVSELHIPNVHIQLAEYLPAGTNLTLPNQPESCTTSGGTIENIIVQSDICRLLVQIDTSPQSQMGLEIWMPRNWTGRFLSGGNGGLTGCYGFFDLAYGTTYGFATVSGNNGHSGNTGLPFLNAPEVLADFAYRAIHTQAKVGKQVVKALYKRPHSKAYFMSCSGGGRQAWKSAQSFPEDFDGIIAASPALDWNSFISWGSYLSSTVGLSKDAPTFLQPNQWDAVTQEILRQCDGLDGAQDSIIEDPDLCQPEFSTLICPQHGNSTSGCLTSIQAAAVTTIFQEPLYGTNGSLIYPRLAPGSQAISLDWYFSGDNHQYIKDWFKYVVYSDPNFDDHSLSRTDYDISREQDPFNISTFNGDLSVFRSRGGKLLSFHGMEDGLISPGISTRYYQHVAQTMGLPSSELDDFYRYFKVSGLAHCSGGSGASSVGLYQYGVSESVLPFTPENNVLARIVAWVERNEAPDYLRGYKLASTSPLSVEYSRKHCKYPKRNAYVGPGPYTDENAWLCR